MQHRNATYAFIEGLRLVLSQGQRVHVRGMEVLELRNHLTILERPLERSIIVPRRNNNIFATIAETMWVVAGRDDLAFLNHYLPRASDFSDDGTTWRAAYGPRLRNWRGVDQVAEVLRLLRAELATRRAVMSIFDPAVDFIDSKDIPCNNWLHWLARDGRLHLNVSIRSNDVIWGFSGINTFEWSVLHEMLAHWCGVDVGQATFFASSFHLYERHEKRAREMVDVFPGVTCYEYGLDSPRFDTPWERFGDVLREWLELEQRLRRHPDAVDDDLARFPDPLLQHFLSALQLYNGSLLGWSNAELRDRIANLPETDLTAAACEYFERRPSESNWSMSHPTIARYEERSHITIAVAEGVYVEQLRGAIMRMHAGKSAAYGDSWKRRGEQIGVIANIARKIDRLEQVTQGATSTLDESLLDTVVDLYVYLTKYRTFLADQNAEVAEREFGSTPVVPAPFSEGLEGFNWLVRTDDLTEFEDSEHASVATVADRVVAGLAELEACFHEAHVAPAVERLELAKRLSVKTIHLLAAVQRTAPDAVRRFVDSW